MLRTLPLRPVLMGLLCVAVATAGSTSIQSRARADSPGSSDPVPVLSQWSPTTMVWRDPMTQTMLADVYASPVQVQDPSSENGWAPVNTDLAATADGVAPQT